MSNQPTLPRPLRGIVPPMITPLAGRDRLDVPGLERLVERILAARPGGLFILGTTGEGPGLSYKCKQELIDRVAELVGGRVPLLVGVTDPSPAESIELADYAADAGAQAVVLAPPYYLGYGQVDLLAYLDGIVPELPLPVFLYHIPGLTKVGFELDTVRRAMDMPQVVGLKDSSGDMIRFHKLRAVTARRPDFSLLVGPEELLAEAVLAGAHGGVSGGANLRPQLYVDLYEACRDDDLDRVRELHERVMALASTVYAFDAGAAGVIKGLKTALSLLGVTSDLPAEPLQPLSREKREALVGRLERLGLLEPSEPGPVPDWQKEELARRKANLANHPASGLTWDEVTHRVRGGDGR